MNPDPIFESNFLNLEYVFYHITKFFQDFSPSIKGLFTSGKIGAFLVFFFSILLILVVAWIAYSMARIHEIQRKQAHEISQKLFVEDKDERRENPRWLQVQEYINSQNQAEWRMAVIEADTILEEMVNKFGTPGENLGEKLKNTEPSDFLTLQNAWEGHKVRNRIAHEGAAYNLTYKEARQAIDNFEQVFREFEYI
jgi:CYTH domain-containing protein